MTQTPASGQAGQNPYGLAMFTVQTPTGADLTVQTQEEAQWYDDRRERYTADNQFPNVSDLQDLDRLLLLEMMIHRWSLWMAQGFDYLYTRIEEGALKNNIKEYSQEARMLKTAMGIDKATRNKDKSESLADYVANLLDRAKTFGYHRNEQYEIVVTKMYELRSMIMTFDRCDEDERVLLDLSYETIFDWIRDNVIKDFDEHSEAFRVNQTMWVKEL